MAEILFWCSILFVSYSYFGYPLVLLAVSRFRPRSVHREAITPRVSLIIAAHNEETRIRAKIENALTQDYPRDALEILVASDCASDRTDEIVGSYAARGVRLVRAPERRGKEAAQKLAVDVASGELLIFSDAATILPPNGIAQIVKSFADPSVGCVSSVDRVLDRDGQVSPEGAYVRYEMFLRSLETKVNSLVGLSGSFFAARREVCREWAIDLQSDFSTVLNAVKAGLRGVTDPESIAYYTTVANDREEFDRKSRTVLRGISVLMRHLSLLNPVRYGLFAWQLFSHKLCRWLVPFAMGAAFLTNVFVIPISSWYGAFFVLQCTFYALAFWGISRRAIPGKRLVKVASFLVLSNLSILNAWYRYLRGERLTMWLPSQR